MISLVTKAHAATITMEDFGVTGRIGAIYNFYNIFVWAYNMCIFAGGFFVAAGIMWTLGNMAFKMWGEPDTDTFEVLRGGASKTLMIAVIGVLLLGLGSLFKFVGSLLGVPIQLSLPVELNFISW